MKNRAMAFVFVATIVGPAAAQEPQPFPVLFEDELILDDRGQPREAELMPCGNGLTKLAKKVIRAHEDFLPELREQIENQKYVVNPTEARANENSVD